METPKLNDLISDLQTAKELAIQNGNPNALVTATLAQAKLLGLDKPIIVDHRLELQKNEIQSISDLMDELGDRGKSEYDNS